MRNESLQFAASVVELERCLIANVVLVMRVKRADSLGGTFIKISHKNQQ